MPVFLDGDINLLEPICITFLKDATATCCYFKKVMTKSFTTIMLKDSVAIAKVYFPCVGDLAQ